jgi:hypothetical protein
MRDPHFHLYGVNWVPRAWSTAYIGFFDRHKAYTPEAGRQRLDEMHYYTLAQFRGVLADAGLTAVDSRELQIKRRYSGIRAGLAIALYRFLRPWYFDAAHLLAYRSGESLPAVLRVRS